MNKEETSLLGSGSDIENRSNAANRAFGTLP